MPDAVTFLRPVGGMNGASDPARLDERFWCRSSNVALRDELPSTRPRVRIYKLEPEAEGDLAADDARPDNVQGAIFFNPAKGQGARANGKDYSQLLASIGGKKYRLTVEGVSAATRVLLKNISGRFNQPSLLHLAWIGAAENYAIFGDGNSNTLIYNGATETMAESPGYNSNDKELSRLPNGATATVYLHGRICMVVNSRQIVVGDQINKKDQSSAVDLLGTTEQTYWNTGTAIFPPSAMGNVLALAILPLRNTQHGHSDGMAMCEDGVFSFDINRIRSTWAESAIVKHVLLSAGAAGPYALAQRDGDILYRTRHGIVGLRSAVADADTEGNPQAPMSKPIQTLLQGDNPEWLRFASLVVWEQARRMFCTAMPQVDGRHRWHLGFVVRNFGPDANEESRACWEGLWTLPEQAAGVVQFVGGMFNGRERMFALARGSDGNNRLVEFTQEQGDDILEDGTRQRIRCQLVTRAIDMQMPFLKKAPEAGVLFLKNVQGQLDWGVWVRPFGEQRFTLWRSGKVNVAELAADGLNGTQSWSGPIGLGSFPKSCLTGQGKSRYFQFLLRWKGVAQFETLRMTAGAVNKEQVDPLGSFEVSFNTPLPEDYSDYEYSAAQTWEVTNAKQR